MVRISAHLHFGLHGAHRRLDRRRGFFALRLYRAESALVALGVLTALAVYNAIAARSTIGSKQATSSPIWRAVPAIWPGN